MSLQHFLSVADLSTDQLIELLDEAAAIKATPAAYQDRLEGKSLGLIFEKSSTRTRVSFEVGMRQLGGFALFLSSADLQLGRGESIADTARVLSRYLDGIMARVNSHEDLLELAKHSSIPVINGLSDELHPCQALADLMTIREHFGELSNLKLAYIGDGNNVASSLMLAAAGTGLDVALASPHGYEVKAPWVDRARQLAAENGSDVCLCESPDDAVVGAQVVYTDVWTSMGQEAETAIRLRDFNGFEVDADLMARAEEGAIFLHCLPCHRGEEVSAEVVDGSQSRIFDQAENRLHAQKAVLVSLIGR